MLTHLLTHSILVVGTLVGLVCCQNATENVAEERFVTPCQTPNRKSGHCVEIQQCEIFMKALRELNNATFPFIRASTCGPQNQNLSLPKVCCGSDINFIQPDGNQLVEQTGQEHISAPSISTPLPIHLKDPLPEVCGKQRVVVTRIFGGETANVGEFPWMARIVHRNAYNHTSLGCSGFLIHRKFVLTAGHCIKGTGVRDLGGIVGVILGSHDSTRQGTCIKFEDGTFCSPTPKFIETLPPIVHANYDLRENTNDIGLIPFKTKVSFGDFIMAICLSRVESTIPELIISGWGKTESAPTSEVKLKVTIPKVDREYCSQRYRTIGKSILDMQICAGGVKGKDSCAGDSGGPLMAFNVEDEKWYAEGIVSFGLGCGREEWPGVYTNVPKYYNWIVDNIRRNKP